MSTKKEIIEDVFGKGVTLNTIKNQFGSYLKGNNRLLKDVDQAVEKIFDTPNTPTSMEKFSNRIKTYKKYMDRELKESKSKKLGDGLKDGARTKVRGTGAANKGFRKAKLS